MLSYFTPRTGGPLETIWARCSHRATDTVFATLGNRGLCKTHGRPTFCKSNNGRDKLVAKLDRWSSDKGVKRMDYVCHLPCGPIKVSRRPPSHAQSSPNTLSTNVTTSTSNSSLSRVSTTRVPASGSTGVSTSGSTSGSASGPAGTPTSSYTNGQTCDQINCSTDCPTNNPAAGPAEVSACVSVSDSTDSSTNILTTCPASRQVSRSVAVMFGADIGSDARAVQTATRNKKRRISIHERDTKERTARMKEENSRMAGALASWRSTVSPMPKKRGRKRCTALSPEDQQGRRKKSHTHRDSAVVTASATPTTAISNVVVRVSTANVIHRCTHGYGRGNSDAEREMELTRDGSPGREQEGTPNTTVMEGCVEL